MTVNRTTLLDLPLPVTGTESGTWGDTTNNGLTQYLDIAIAGSLVLSADSDTTLSSTEGDSSATNIGGTTAQYAVLRCTGARTTTRNINAPAWAISGGTISNYSKTYVVINDTTGGQSIVLRATNSATPTYTTGVTIVAGERAVCAWNGSDFVKVGGAAGGSNTQVQYNNGGVFGGVSGATTNGTAITFSTTNLKLQGSSTGVSSFASANSSATDYTVTFPAASTTIPVATQTLTFSGPTAARTITLPDANFTAARTDSAQTFTGVQTFSSNPILSGGTANGVLYLNGSSAATSGSALTFDGTTFQYTGAANFATSSGNVGIGTSSPAVKLDVVGFTNITNASTVLSGTAKGTLRLYDSTAMASGVGAGLAFLGQATTGSGAYTTAGSIQAYKVNGTSGNDAFGLQFTTRSNGSGCATVMSLDDSGNLGLGVTPSGWASTYRAYQVGQAGSLFGLTNDQDRVGVSSNAYFDTTDSRWEYIGTGYAMRYDQNAGEHQWYTAASGAANGAITFTQAMTLDASGDWVVGGTTPDVFGTGFQRNATVVASGATASVNISGSSASRIQFGVGSTRYSIIYQDASNFMQIGTTTALPISFQTNSTERARITSGGVLDLATGAGAVGQIQFPATQVASSNANTLDDYEEGSWTCTMVGSGGGSVSLGTGYYVKVGQVVYCYFDAFSVSTSGLSGNISFQGLPFTSHASVSQSSYMFPTGANNTPCVFYVEQGQTNVTLYKAASGSSSVSSFTVSDFVTSTPSMRHSFVYRTNS